MLRKLFESGEPAVMGGTVFAVLCLGAYFQVAEGAFPKNVKAVG